MMIFRPIGALLALPEQPTCDARIAAGEGFDECLRRVKRAGDRCWQHR